MVTINLIPAPVQTAQTRKRHLRRWGMLIAAALAATAVPAVAHWAQHFRIDELKAAHHQLQGDVAAARGELKTLTVESNDLFLRIERAKALRSKRNWSGMLALVASCLPADCWLTSFATDPDVPSAAPVERKPAPVAVAVNAASAPVMKDEKAPSVTIEAPRRLRLMGQATNASRPLTFVSRLKDAGVFRDVVLERSQREGTEESALFRFELVCEW